MEAIFQDKHAYETPEVVVAKVIGKQPVLHVSNYDGAETD